ncbi:MAG TPA: phosphate acyltransferase PlsX [Neisseriales bacterium]|jgi:glycerol-3-phosphate acyltransferase PlsX|nr:phosphate acyltransferase PlsX [Neisseriales bacterium]
MAIILAVDAMGGDHGVNITVPSCLRFLDETVDVNVVLVGDRDAIYKQIGDKLSQYSDRIDVVHATQVVGMDEAPQSAMRTKRDSSMRLAINLVKEGKANAIVSAGNTGALMAISRYVLRTMDGIDRPAIAKLLPTVKGEVCMLDLGANIECSPEHLVQFGIMGAQLMRGVTGKTSPSVGILNIGSEDIKGNETVKKAAELLKKTNLNFYGNVEGDDIFKSVVDVVVTDGFTGNVSLKTTEGVAKMIVFFLKEEFTRSWITKLIALISYPVLKRLKLRLNPSKYNGAVLLGLNGLVIKSHGGADIDGFYYALVQAHHEVDAGVIGLLQDYLQQNKHLDEDVDELIEFNDLKSL